MYAIINLDHADAGEAAGKRTPRRLSSDRATSKVGIVPANR